MERKSRGLGKFIAGALLGAGLGILFAPKSGEETRKDLKKLFDDTIAKIKEIDVVEVRESFLKKINEIKEEIASLDKEKVASIAKEKAELIKVKLDELLAEAKEKANPVIEKTIESLKTKTTEILKETVKKLENSDKNEDSSKTKKAKN